MSCWRHWLMALPIPLPAVIVALLVGPAFAATPLLIAGSSTVKPVANAWQLSASLASQYDITLEGGGSSNGARRVCLPRDDPEHVNIGDMSRNWKSSEAVLLDDGYTYECLSTKIRVTQIIVGVDGLAVVVAKNSAAHNCLLLLGGLTLAQLRWMFSDWSDAELLADGLDMSSVVPNDNNNGIKEWSDLNTECSAVPVNPYGAGDQSGTYDFFGEVALCKNCFGQKAGYPPEGFPFCNSSLIHTLESYSNMTDIEHFIENERPNNCYMPSEVDEKILQWIEADTGGIGYFGFAYYSLYAALLTVAPIAGDKQKGVQDTLDAKISPSSYSITDGSYSVFRRMLYMNVDNEAWNVSRSFFDFGFSDEGQTLVAGVGYVTVNANLRNKMGQRISEQGNDQADYVPVQPERCWNGTELKAVPYINQFGREKVEYSCEACEAGKYKRLNTPTQCILCGEGSYTEAAGLSECSFCSPGSSAEEGSAGCSLCEVNTATNAPGQGSCTPCSAGFEAQAEGATDCSRCSQGTYRSENESQCSPCPAGMTTKFEAATNPLDCVCAAGSYLPVQGIACKSCPEGMACDIGTSMDNYNHDLQAEMYNIPLLLPGFSSSVSDPLNVFKCLNAGNCPGGRPGSCAFGLTDTACSRCPDGQSLKRGQCQACDATGILWMALGIPGLMAGLTTMHVAVNWPMIKGNKAMMTAVYFIGMAVTMVLTFGIYGTLDAVWKPPLSDFIPRLSIFRFDLESFDFSCVTGQDAYILQYAVRLLGFPIAFLWAFVGAQAASRVRPLTRFVNLNWAAFRNTAGYLMSALFVSVSLMSLEGLRCSKNPNGKSTLMANESVLCWEGGQHTGVLIMSFIAVLVYPVLYLSLTGYAAWMFGPLSVRYGLSFTTSVRFLAGRMKPELVVFSFGWNVRNFLISLAPVIAANQYAAQIALITLLFLTWTGLQAKYDCWRFPVLNLMDTIVGILQVMMLLFFGLLGSEATDVSTIGYFIIVILTATLMLLLCLAGRELANYLSGSKAYDVFLSHHKAAAALEARHMKMLFQSVSSNINAFLDVDELDNLDNLMFAVKNTRKFLILMTEDILRRPWCAVEIGTAFLNKVPIAVVQMKLKLELTPGFLDDVMASFKDSDIAILSKNGITLADLRSAYDHVAGLPAVELKLNSTDDKAQLQVMKQLAGEEVMRSARAPAVVAVDPEKVVYLAYNTSNPAQAIVANIMKQLFRGHRWNAFLMCESNETCWKELGRGARKGIAVVLVSQGLTNDAVGLAALAAFKRAKLSIVTVLSQESFWKPPDELFESMRSGTLLTSDQWRLIMALLPEPAVSGDELADALVPIYKILAWSFSPEQNSALLDTEFGVVEQRAAKELERFLSRMQKGETKDLEDTQRQLRNSDYKLPSISENSAESKDSTLLTAQPAAAEKAEIAVEEEDERVMAADF